MEKITTTLDSREVAKMIRKEHKALMRDIRRYINQINECNLAPVDNLEIAPGDFFRESTYYDGKGEMRPCYQITRKGCEFIANKLTGTKGTAFTARYINRFHEMEDIITEQQAQKKIERELRDTRKLLEEKDRRIKELEAQGRITYDEVWYRQEIQRYTGLIINRRRLSQIYTIAKNLYTAEQGVKTMPRYI